MGKMIRYSIVVVLFANFFLLKAQDPADLYMFSLRQTQDGLFHVFGAKFLSGFNPDGYTNQPFFTRTGDLLVSVRKAGELQNDIWWLSPVTRRTKRISNTTDSEYSPRISPDGRNYSMVIQSSEKEDQHHVAIFPIYGGKYNESWPEFNDVGYYTWISDAQLGLFRIQGDEHSLSLYNLQEETSKKITTAVGRSLWADGQKELIYVHKFNDTYWYLKKYNPTSGAIDILIETPGKTEDFALAPDGTYFMGVGSKLYFFHPDRQTTWKECADLSSYGLSNLTRLAISQDGKQIAIVNSK